MPPRSAVHLTQEASGATRLWRAHQAGVCMSLACAGVLRRGARRGRQFNNSRHEYEIFLENSSVLEPCADEEAASIPKMLYHVRPVTRLA